MQNILKMLFKIRNFIATNPVVTYVSESPRVDIVSCSNVFVGRTVGMPG